MNEEKKNNNRILLTIILSVLFSSFAFLGFIFLYRIDYEDIVRIPLLFYIIPFILLGLLYYWRINSHSLFSDKLKLIISFLLAFLFALSLIAGSQLRVSIALASGIKGKIGIIVKSAALSFLFIPVFELILSCSLSNITNNSASSSEDKSASGLRNRIIVFFVSWFSIFICWIPVFLAYWPGIMSYDSHRQFNEAYNNIFWELQPIAHTFLIRLSLLIGQKIGSLEVGVAMHSILQMATLSMSLGYVTSLIYKICKNKAVVIVSIIFYAFLPITSVLSVSVTKDIFFTAFFLTLCTALIERFCTSVKIPAILNIIIVISGSLMMLFRKNGIYGFVLYSIVFLIVLLVSLIKKDSEKVKESAIAVIICSITIIVGILTMNVVKISLHAGSGPAIEKYSVMIQQFARVAYYHKDNLSKEDAELIDNYLPGYSTTPQYNFSLADAPKYNANGEAFSNTSAFIFDWLHIVINYPEDCIDAYLGLISGYFFTDDIAISRYLGYGRESMRGLLETFNAVKPGAEGDVHIESNSKLPRLQYFMEGIVSNEEYLYYPLIPILFRPAFYIWIAITCIAALVYKKRYQLILVSSLQITYFLTVLLGPVSNIRYAFQIILAVPLLLTIAFITNIGYDSDSHLIS